MNQHLTDSDVQQFIKNHLNDDTASISFRKSPFSTVSSKELAEQIDAKKRSEKKLPLWFATENIIYPQKLAVEQCSSELTAIYKSSLARGSSLIDLTGGFGVDSFYFSQKIEKVTSCELNAELSEIAAYNAHILGAHNISVINADSIDYLTAADISYDTLFVDPSRRIKTSRVFMLKDCEPDVVSNMDLLRSKANRIIIKTSPLLDLHAGLKELQRVTQIHVISVKNDCKELLWILDNNEQQEPEIICVALGSSGPELFSFKLSEESLAVMRSWSEPLKYLYEPDVALLKAGCFKLISSRFGIEKLSINTHLYTSDSLKQFIGRTFEVIQSSDYKAFTKNNIIKKANIISRNFPHTPEQLKKKHKISDGGEDYLFFTTGSKNQLLAIHAKRLK